MDDLMGRTICVLDELEQSQIPGEMKEILASLRSVVGERLAIHKISYRQSVPLRHLSRRPSCNVTELAKSAGTDLGAMTRMLERLETKGLLERRRSSTDRRVVYVNLLEAGATIAALVDDVLLSVTEDHLKDFALQERAQLREFLERMRLNGRGVVDACRE